MRRDRPQASGSRHRRTDRPILSPLIPGCSVAGDQDPSRLLVRGPMPRRRPECELATPRQRPSAPRSQGGRMLAADGCASSSSNLACCFCGAWAPAGRGSGGRHVRALTRLGMLICRNEYFIRAHSHARTGMLTYVPLSYPGSSCGLFYCSGRKSDRRDRRGCCLRLDRHGRVNHLVVYSMLQTAQEVVSVEARFPDLTVGI